MDCGFKYPKCVMHFDHLPQYQKRAPIAKMLANGCSIESLKQERAKCDLVCANCHAIRTFITRPYGTARPA